MRKLRVLAVLAVVAVLAVGVGVGAARPSGADAQAPTVPVTVSVTAVELLEDGTRVRVSLTVTCPTGLEWGNVIAFISQTQGRIVTGGHSGYTPLLAGDCTGSPRPVQVTVSAPLPFRPGPAALQASMGACVRYPETGYIFCGDHAIAQVVRLH